MTTARSARPEMRPFGDLVSFAEARTTAMQLCDRDLGATRLAIADAGGRVLTEAVRSPADVPSADRAAMDGYAVRAADIAAANADVPVVLREAGSRLAGDLEPTDVQPGSCIEIATGAPLPAGSDAVVPVEHTRGGADGIAILIPSAPGEHVSRRAEDLAVGDAVASAGDVVTPGIAGALASIGVDAVNVRKRPRALLVPTGDELVPLGASLRPGQVYDSNSVALQVMARAAGAVVERTAIVKDDADALVAALQRSAFDIVVTLGGTSVGRHDLVLDVIQSMGEVLVHGVAIKPGKPVLLARVAGTIVVGLPGFPTSCLMTGYLFAEPMIRKLAGLPIDVRRRRKAVLGEAVRSPAAKRQFLTVRLRDEIAEPVYRASSSITSTSRAGGWIEIDEATTEVAAGTSVEVTLF